MNDRPNRPNVLRLHPSDNVVIAMRKVAAGEALAGEGISASEAIGNGHKIATAPIAAGATVRKYGQVIGAATADIAPGAHVHSHNLAMSALREDAAGAQARPLDVAPRSFEGFRRANGKAGVRNYIGVLTSVNCSATVARHIAEAAEKSGLLARFPNVDGIVPITHASGCGMAGSGEGFDILKRTLIVVAHVVQGRTPAPSLNILGMQLQNRVEQLERDVELFGVRRRFHALHQKQRRVA